MRFNYNEYFRVEDKYSMDLGVEAAASSDMGEKIDDVIFKFVQVNNLKKEHFMEGTRWLKFLGKEIQEKLPTVSVKKFHVTYHRLDEKVKPVERVVSL